MVLTVLTVAATDGKKGSGREFGIAFVGHGESHCSVVAQCCLHGTAVVGRQNVPCGSRHVR